MNSSRPAGEFEHNNSFGALRLIFSYAVIISHSAEMLDGNRTREIMNRLGSRYTLGGLAVDGFFLISGYLVAASYLKNPRLGDYFVNRVLRIYPAFIAASLICFLLIGPFAGGDLLRLGLMDWLKAGARLILLREPQLQGSFGALPVATLDGSMWTIAYEFRCYLLVAILGLSGILGKRRWILGLTVLAYGVAAYCEYQGGALDQKVPHLLHSVIGLPSIFFPLAALFLTGVCFRVFSQWQKAGVPALVFSALICLLAVLRLPLGDLLFGIFGGFVIFFIAALADFKGLKAINNRYDYSYGIYLYAWPIASLLMLGAQSWGGDLMPWQLSVLTIGLSTIAGAVSWYFLERPALRLKHGRLITNLSAKVRLF